MQWTSPLELMIYSMYVAGEWILGCFGRRGEEHHHFPPHHVERKFRGVEQGFDVHFQRPG